MSTGNNASGDALGEACHLFPIEWLTKLTKWADIARQLEAGGLLARPLESTDHERGYLDLLRQLTVVGEVSKQEFEARFREMQRINQLAEHYIIVVVEDKTSKRIVGCSTLFIEYKFIHQCSKRGRLEDVAVLNTYRSRKIGELLVGLIVELAREPFKCYKLTLDCKDELKKFYAKNQFRYGSNMLEIRFKH